MNIYPVQSFLRYMRFAAFLFALSLLNSGGLTAQTDFAPGEIMFIGYSADGTDEFSIVLLTDALSGTVIYITDQGWSNSTGFATSSNSEGTIELTFNDDYPCGTEILFTDSGGANDWEDPVNQNGDIVGTVVILAGESGNGPALSTGGDQLFIYQNPKPTSGDQSSFVTGIHMNGGWNGGNGNENISENPNGLANDQMVRLTPEVDNAKYDCSVTVGLPAVLQAAITTDGGTGNWQTSNFFSLDLTPECYFCCGNTAPEDAPTLSGPSFVAPDEVFDIDITGTLGSGESWELYTTGCGDGTPDQTTMGSTFTITAPSTEQTITYYVRTSEAVDCEAFCAEITIEVCDVDDYEDTDCTDCSADITECGDCYLPPPADNPNLDSGCYNISLIFVLDESGSIGNNDVDVRDGVLAFLNAINGQDAQAALIEFSGTARLVNDYTTVDQTYIDDIDDYFSGVGFNGQDYDPGGGTNWHDAMREVDDLATADLVLFFTDGVPTVWNNGATCGNGATTQPPEIVNPVKLSNKIKGEGSHMFMLGVGGGVQESNLQAMSGLDEYVEGDNTLGTSDYSIGNFEDLADDLESFILELCQTTIIVEKDVLGPICNGQVEFRFRVINTGDESAASITYLTDTFPSGYDNPTYNPPDPPVEIKLCFENGCDPPLPDNAFIWVPGAIPPGDTAELIVTVDVLETGEFDNIAWAWADNAEMVSDTFDGDLLTEDLPPTIACPSDITIECDESTLPENTGNPTADNPDGPDPTLTYVDTEEIGSCPQERVITRTWTATDNCANIATCVQLIDVIDTTPPDITCPPDVTIECDADPDPGFWGTATASDNCGGIAGITYTDEIIPGSCIPESTILRTWVAEDVCGNTASCVQTLYLKDSTPPSLECAPNVSIPCEESTLPANTGFTTMKPQNCGGTGVITYEDEYIIQDDAPQCSIIRTWTGTDDCGNSSTCVQLIEVVDNVTPTLTCPPNVTLTCVESTSPDDTGLGTAVDNCDVAPVVTYSDDFPVPTCDHQYVINRTWIASDECGNNTSCVQVITVDDNVAPAMTCPPDLTIECTDDTLPTSTGAASATDNCDGAIDIVYSDVTIASPDCPQEYTIERTWMAADICGNSGTCVQTIFIDDSTPPEITCPANLTISCTDNTLPDSTGLATAVDNCDPAPTVSYSDLTSSLPSCAQEYLITRTWVAMDACGNTSTCDQVITIDDSTPPVITCPVDVTIACTDSTLPDENGMASATDNCDENPVITYQDDVTGGVCPQESTITRTWTATDACGNFTTCVQILEIIDQTAPETFCPDDITIECTESTLPGNTGLATAIDNCDPTPVVEYSDVTMASPDCIQEYTITRTWTSTDECGNVSSCVQTIVVDDSTPPDITCPSNVTIECTEVTLPENTGEATAIDNCDASPDISYSDVTMAGDCPQEYTITRTWVTMDDCGNTNTCVQTIFIDDSTVPDITCPADITIECTDNTLPENTGEASASDNCDAAPVITYLDVTMSSPDCPQEYTITRTWTATDACGNEISWEQVISIDDSTVPVITCPADVTIECLESTLPENTGEASATDNCDGSPEIIYADITLDDPESNGYFIERTWTATDACGNSSTCLQNITVTNPLDPNILGLALDTICSGDIVVFEGEDPGIDPLTYDWEFGSGSSPGTETGIGPHNVIYTYNGTNGSDGAWVILTLGTPGCMSVSDTVSNIHVNDLPDASFTSPTGNPCVLHDKTFEATAPEVPGYSYEWDFGVGASIPTASTYGPHTVEYFSNGLKTVQLIVYTNEDGASCGDTMTLQFVVNYCPGNITGKVLTDDDTPIAGVNLRLYRDQDLDGMQDDNMAIRSVFTNGEGLYSMAAILPGYYVIVQNQPAGYISLYDEDTSEDMDSVSNLNPNDNIIPVTVEPLELDADNIFVEVTAPGIISGYVFDDFDSDEQPDPAEGIPGVTIELHLDNNLDGMADTDALVASVETTNDGYYTFPNVETGNYVIVEIHPVNYTNVKDIDDSNDGDLVANTNMENDTIPATITNGETDADNYFIESSACSGLVTTLDDDVTGSLRYMVECAEEGDTISFHPLLAGQTLLLTEGRLEIDKNLFIISTLSPRITIQSNVAGGFKILTGNEVEFKNMDIISGLTGYPGAAFDNNGDLTLWDVTVMRNLFLPGTDYLIFNGTSGEMEVKGEIRIETD